MCTISQTLHLHLHLPGLPTIPLDANSFLISSIRLFCRHLPTCRGSIQLPQASPISEYLSHRNCGSSMSSSPQTQCHKTGRQGWSCGGMARRHLQIWSSMPSSRHVLLFTLHTSSLISYQHTVIAYPWPPLLLSTPSHCLHLIACTPRTHSI